MLTVGDNSLSTVFQRFEQNEKRIGTLERLIDSHLDVAVVKDEQSKEKSDELKIRVKELEDTYIKNDDDYKKLKEKVSNSLTIKGFAIVTSIVGTMLAIIGAMIGFAIKK